MRWLTGAERIRTRNLYVNTSRPYPLDHHQSRCVARNLHHLQLPGGNGNDCADTMSCLLPFYTDCFDRGVRSLAVCSAFLASGIMENFRDPFLESQ